MGPAPLPASYVFTWPLGKPSLSFSSQVLEVWYGRLPRTTSLTWQIFPGVGEMSVSLGTAQTLSRCL